MTIADPYKPHQRITLSCAALTVTLGLLALIGWHTDTELLKRVHHSFVAMNPVTAVCLILAGTSLGLLALHLPRPPLLAHITAVAIALIGATKLLNLTTGLLPWIDRWLYQDKLITPGSSWPSLMSPNAAVNFVLVGLALLTLTFQGRRVNLASFCTLSVLALSITPALGYLFFAGNYHRLGSQLPVALHATLGFLLLAVGLLLARPTTNASFLLWKDSAGGTLLRHLLPVAIGLPISLGWLAVYTTRTGWIAAELAFTLVASITMTLGIVLLGHYAFVIHQAERVRRDSERRLKLLSDTARDAIITTDSQGRILMWNAGAASIFGYSTAEVTGQPLSVLMPARFRDSYTHSLRREDPTGQPSPVGQTVILTGQRRSGEEFAMELSMSTWADKGERFFTAILRNVTERVQEQQAQKQLANLIHSSSDSIISRSLDNLILTWNSAAADLYGYRSEEVLGTPFTRLVPPERREDEWRLFEQARQGGTVRHVRSERLHKDGTRVQVSVSYSPIIGPDGVQGVSNISRDITRELQAEQLIHESLAYTQALTRVMHLLERQLELEEVARQVAETISPVLKLGWVGLMKADAESLGNRTVWQAETTPKMFLENINTRANRSTGLAWDAFERQTPFFVDHYAEQHGANQVSAAAGVTSAAFIPLRGKSGRSTLLLALCRFEAPAIWTERDRELIESAAQSINVALERADHLRELHEASLQDVLTGLRNRRAFELDGQTELERARRQQSTFGVMILDLDGLKRVNDTMGHAEGDRVLQVFGEALTEYFRRGDLVYRFGGDEFAVLLSEANISWREAVLGKVKQAVSSVRQAGFPEVDASAGVSFYPHEGETASELVHLADARMYDVKRARKESRERRRQS